MDCQLALFHRRHSSDQLNFGNKFSGGQFSRTIKRAVLSCLAHLAHSPCVLDRHPRALAIENSYQSQIEAAVYINA